MSRALVGAVRPASGRPTIGDVALRSGVSTATVSRVLSGGAPTTEATRARVLAAVEHLGYRPSQPDLNLNCLRYLCGHSRM